MEAGAAMTTRTPSQDTAAEPAVPPLRDVRRALRYPPLLLMALTIAALLLAMGTARATPPEPDAPSYSRAADELARATYEEFVTYLPTEGLLIVTESWGAAEGEPELWRQAFSAPLDDLVWSTEIRPLTDLLGATPSARMVCDEQGVCLEEGDGYRIRLELGVEQGDIKLLSLDVSHDASLGC
jgi:hypothetical protein